MTAGDFESGDPDRVSAPRARRGALLLVAVTGLCVGCALAWAAVARVDRVTRMPGEFRSSPPVSRLHAATPGRIAVLAAEEGMRVAAGQPLIVLESGELGAERARTAAELAGRRAGLRVVEALLAAYAAVDGRRSPISPTTPEASGRLARERRAFEARLAQSRQEERVVAERRRAAARRVVGARRLLANLAERERALRQLKDRSMVPRHEWLAVRERALRAAMDLDSERAEHALQAERLLALERRHGAARAAQVAAWSREAAARRLDIAVLERRLAEVEIRIAAHTLRAPASGTVQELTVAAPGEVVRTGHDIAKIVPGGSRLELTGWLAETDRARVRPGQPAQVKVAALPFPEHGLLAGHIAWIAADAERHPTHGSVYRLSVALDSELDDQQRFRGHVEPGMTATIEARHGERRIIEYLVAPLARVRDEALREY